MLNKTKLGLACLLSFVLLACNENNTDVTNSPPAAANAEPAPQSNNTADKNSEKTDAEVMLEGGKILLNTTMDLVKKQRIKDSINAANKEKMYAYQIGLMYKEKDAHEAYKKLLDANIPNVYVFKAARKEYYIVKFEAKPQEDLELSLGDFKTQLGDNGSEGLKVINLMDFCSDKETIAKFNKSEDGVEIKCLMCD